ncbi:CARDB domain-containing protein [Melittangium boletus]|uniref:CARDB domain-containing protein n=1 Tax=Melittangium boletus TaxID=83453 RepID=UPI003DA5B97D
MGATEVATPLSSGLDFEVAEVSTPPSAAPGSPVDVSVTLCNRGGQSGYASAELFLSADTTWSAETDFPAGVTSSALLMPGQCTQRQTRLSLPTLTEGAWYVGARLPQGDENPGNDLRFSAPMSVGIREDFVVTAVKGPDSVRPGSPLTANITVCNQGTQTASTQVALILSEDPTPRVPGDASPPEDTLVGLAQVPSLAHGQCRTVTAFGNALPPPGAAPATRAFHLGAVVDPFNTQVEFREDNNTFSGDLVGVGQGPDFVITSVTGPTSVNPDQRLISQVTVCNRGTESDSARLFLVLSEDENIRVPGATSPPEDSLLGEFPVHPLQPGQCTPVSIDASATRPPVASPETRAFRLGAVVEASSPSRELIASNNTHPGYLLGMGYGPDFVIRSLTGPASVEHGQPFTAQVTVCNQGTQAGSTQFVLLASEDARFDYDPSSGQGPDALVGDMYVPTLQPGQCTPISLPGSIPSYAFTSDTRALHLGAIVNPRPPGYPGEELITSNNTHPGYLLGVGHGPDFVIRSLTGPASVEHGQSFTAQATVCNQGTRSGSTQLILLASEDARFDSASAFGQGPDAFAGETQVSSLQPGQCLPISIPGYIPSYTFPSEARALHLGAIVNPRPPGYPGEELITSNNTHPGYLLGVGHGPDFVIRSVTGPASVEHGQSFTTQVTVCNQGTRSGSTRLVLLASEDARFDAASAFDQGPDVRVGETPVPSLQPGQCLPLSLPSSIPSYTFPYETRALHLGAIVNPRPPGYPGEELITSNNTHPGYLLGVGYGPDFVIRSVTGPASVEHGQSFTAQVTVCNQGTRSGSTRLVLLASEDARFDAASAFDQGPDIFMGDVYVPSLQPGQCTPLSLPSHVPTYAFPSETRALHLGAIVNPRPPGYPDEELIASNNTHPGYLLGVGQGPDFVIRSVTGPASVEHGQSFTAQVTVCNQGTREGSAPVELLLSTDEQMDFPVHPSMSGDTLVGSAFVNALRPGQCATIPIPGQAQPPSTSTPQRAFHLGAIVNPRPPGYPGDELITSNNTHAGYVLGVGQGPDFVIRSVTGPASVEHGQATTAQVTVCNQGTGPGSTDVALVLSEDAHIQLDWPHRSSPDVVVGMAPIGTLAPGQCGTVSISGTIHPPAPGSSEPRAFHLGAVVNPHEVEFPSHELVTSNNTHAGYLLGVGAAPDFILTAVEHPVFTQGGQPLTTRVTVCNQGTREGSTRVSVLLSTDTTLRAPGPDAPFADVLVGEAFTGNLRPGWCETVSLTAPVWPLPPSGPGTPGPVYVGVVVNPAPSATELRTDNNSLLGGWMYIAP